MNPLNLLLQSQPPKVMEIIDSLARTHLSTLTYLIAALTVVRLAVLPSMNRIPAHQRSGGGFGVLKFINETADALIYAGGLVFLVIRPFAIQTFYVPSESMVPTLMINDFLIGNKSIYRMQDPRPGEIVVFRPPAAALNPGEDKYFIKRCVGVPGDVIEVREGLLYRNGKLVNETYNTQGPSNFDYKLVKLGDRYIPVTITASGFNVEQYTAPLYRENAMDAARQNELSDAKPEAIPPGFYMMMGDNRNFSFDGRGWGLVPRRDIISRAEWRYRAPLNFTKLDHPVIP